jgi:hypothetical protein
MFIAFINNTKIINAALLNQECVTIKLFGLTTKLLITDIEMFIFGLVICVILADMLADYMLFTIEEAKRGRDQTNTLLDEIKKLQEEIIDLKALKGIKKVTSQMIIQCDKCYNEYSKNETQKCNIVGNIFQQYCTECFKNRKA